MAERNESKGKGNTSSKSERKDAKRNKGNGGG